MSRTLGLLLTVVGGLAVAAGIGLGATSLVASDESIDSQNASNEAGTSTGSEQDLFIYGTR